MILLPLFLSYGLHANAGQLNPNGLVKAKLFSFRPKVEAISGIVDCEDELNNVIEGLGRKIALGSSSEWMGRVSEDAYNEALGRYRAEDIEKAGGTVVERRKRLFALIPPHQDFERRPVETPESLRVDFANYLVDEFVRLEMAAIILRTVRELEYHFYPNEKFPPIEYYALPGDRGQSLRLIMFFRDIIPKLPHELEPGFQVFADSMLTAEVIKESISVNQLEMTQELFGWMHMHNPVMYLYLLEKYHPYISEEQLHADHVGQVQ